MTKLMSWPELQWSFSFPYALLFKSLFDWELDIGMKITMNNIQGWNDCSLTHQKKQRSKKKSLVAFISSHIYYKKKILFEIIWVNNNESLKIISKTKKFIKKTIPALCCCKNEASLRTIVHFRVNTVFDSILILLM